MRTTSRGIQLILAAAVTIVLAACGSTPGDSGASQPDAGSNQTSSTSDKDTPKGCDIKRPDSGSDEEGAPFFDVQTDVLMKCGWPASQISAVGKNAAYLLSPFGGAQSGYATCVFMVFNAKHTKSFVDPTIMSKSKVAVRAQYMTADGAMNGIAPGTVTVDSIYEVTPDFILSLRDNKHIDLSKCGRTTPVS